MKIYDTVKSILQDQPATRNSDQELIWQVYGALGFVDGQHISYRSFKNAPSTETIRRSRQHLQKRHDDLEPTSEKVRRARGFKEKQKGTFIFREEGGQGAFI